MARSLSHAVDRRVVVRPFRPEDHSAVLPIWQRGFLELAEFVYRDIASLPVFLAMTSLTAAAAFLGRTHLAVAAAAGTSLLYSPLGLRALKALLWRGILRETHRDMTPDALATKWSQAGKASFWVAEIGGRVVGCVGVKGHHTLFKERRDRAAAPLPGEASVWRLSVDEGARRLGVARALMEEVHRWARGNGYRRVSLVCGNPNSKRFYASIGYRPLPLSDAMAMVFGPGQAPRSLLDHVKAWVLRGRVERRGNVLALEL